jgi:hypothetical protein
MRYFNDDGTEFNPDLMPLPDLCASCRKRDNPSQEVLCSLTRADGQNEEVFLCFAYEPESSDVSREAVLRDLCEQAGVDYPDKDIENPDEPEVIHF